MSPTLGAGSSSAGGADSFSDRQFMVVTSEKTARVIALPSQNCVYRQQITDTDYVVKAEIISLKGMIERVGFEKKAMTNEMVMGNIDSPEILLHSSMKGLSLITVALDDILVY